MSGKNLFGEGGALAPMLKRVIEKALEAGMDAHLNEQQRSKGNKRNGKGKKTLKSRFGNTPEDRQSSFEPVLVKKRQTILADQLSDRIIPEVKAWQNRPLEPQYCTASNHTMHSRLR